MFLITLDRESPEPLTRQIVRAVVEGIEGQLLKPGDPLPATRRLSEELGISRFTAERAYEELWAEGYTESRAGSATRVRARPPIARRVQAGAVAQGVAGGGRTGFDALVDPGLGSILDRAGDSVRQAGMAAPGTIDFARFNLDPRIYPVEAFRRSLDRVLRSDPAEALSYGPPAGSLRLREAIAKRMMEHGVVTDAEGIVLTDGALHGLDLLLRLLTRPGEAYLCEAPTFPAAISAGRILGLRPVGLPMDGEGVLPDSIPEACDKARSEGYATSILYSAPSFHNPTGSLQGQRRREAVLSACASRDLVVIEDCFEEEIGFFGKLVKPMASMDSGGRVAYMGTFSKVLFPGVRVGWVAGPAALAQRLARLRAATGVAGNSLVQAALADFLESGAYDAHVRRLNRVFSRRLHGALAAFRVEVPAELATLRAPAGGYLMWLALHPAGASSGGPPLDQEEIRALEGKAVEACGAEGLLVTAGFPFWPETAPGAFLRLSVAGRDEAETAEGMRRLGRALRRLAAARS